MSHATSKANRNAQESAPVVRSERTDVYTRITSQIVELLELGVRPWQQPWQSVHAAGSVSRPLRHNGQKYQGINVIQLWMTAELKGYSSPYWLSYKQSQELGGNVNKGEHGTEVVYANTFKKKEENEQGEEIEQEIPFLKSYTVFNSEQCSNLPEHFTRLIAPTMQTHERITQAETFFANTKADIRTGGSRAMYSITNDYIQMPPFETFINAESHAATLAHELTHWTRHESRLHRDCGRKSWGDEGYAMEESVTTCVAGGMRKAPKRGRVND